MQIRTRTIRLALPFGMGSVNSYLIDAGSGYVLIDSGAANGRKRLTQELEIAGCRPGLLRLVVLTHGDFEHSGNAAHLRGAFGCTIAMHGDDSGMVERGDMFVNRKKHNALIRRMLPLLAGFGKAERFTPDLAVKDGDDLSGYGIDARIIWIPGHSRGSIGILTADGDLFCGDLLENTDKPALGSIMDDPAAGHASVQKLLRMRIGTVYPGHGRPFPMRAIGLAVLEGLGA